MGESERWTVPALLAGDRVDRIVSVLSGISRSAVRRMIDDGDVTIEGATVRPSARLAEGVVVEGVIPQGDHVLRPAAVPFAVSYEDDDLIVVDKPTGVVVHPGAGHADDTLLNGLVDRFPELLSLGERLRFGMIHRLDRETSGLLIVARSVRAHVALREAMRARTIERCYLGLACGPFPADAGTVDAPIGRDPSHPTRMALVRDGRHARTHYRALATWEHVRLLEIKLETGRTHQIRVHLASIGAPLAGDGTYGRSGGPGDPGRVWLHATLLRFPHPVGGDDVRIESALPEDLTSSLSRLGPPLRGDLSSLPGRPTLPG